MNCCRHLLDERRGGTATVCQGPLLFHLGLSDVILAHFNLILTPALLFFVVVVCLFFSSLAKFAQNAGLDVLFYLEYLWDLSAFFL